MRRFLFLISVTALVQSRPQTTQTHEPLIELEKQTVLEAKPASVIQHNSISTERNVDADTKEILEKIAEVNKKQGLMTRRQKPNFFHFPFSYSRSQTENSPDRRGNDFKFSTNPFSNPILEYLERERHDNHDQKPSRYSTTTPTTRHGQEYAYGISMSNPNAEVTEDDIIPGQYVKRKIVHQQTLLIPNPNIAVPPSAYMLAPNAQLPYMPQANPAFANTPIQVMYPEKDENYSDQKVLSSLEKQTIDNIRNIVSNSQYSQLPYYPYQLGNSYQYSPSRTQYDLPGQNYQTQQNRGRQNWNWPGAPYFPIHIRDPFLQMYNAITSMVEYGPNAGSMNPCPGRPSKKEVNGDVLQREGKTSGEDNESTKISVEVTDTSPQVTISGVDDTGYLDLENVDVGSSKDNSLKFTVNLRASDREAKDGQVVKGTWDQIKMTGKAIAKVHNTTSRANSKVQDPSLKDLRPSTIAAKTPPKYQPILSPPARDPTRQTVEFGDEESEKSEEIISNDGNKKLFSRDNTGSGVFIHKLKVRKGGVAIAGPGGIATAGSGGTAIVGPNGVAYTHPDSLAIAGSGTKVVAVDPTINLGDLVNNSAGGNRTRLEGFPPSRVGKVVAVGPVVYYNRG